MRPTAAGRKPARRRKVIESDDGLQSARAAAFDHAQIVIEHGQRELAGLGFDSRPLERESIGIEIERVYEIEIDRPELQTVVGIADRFGEQGGLELFQKPHVGVYVVPLDLMTGCGGAPDEALREALAGRRSGAPGAARSKPGTRESDGGQGCGRAA